MTEMPARQGGYCTDRPTYTTRTIVGEWRGQGRLDFFKNMYKLCIFMRFSTILRPSFILISLMSKPLTIWILSVRSSLLFLLSAIAPKIKVRSRGIE